MGCHWKKLWHILQIVLLVSFSPFSGYVLEWEGKNGTFFVSPKKSQHYSKGGLPKISKLIPKTPYFLLQCVTWTFTANIGSTLYFLLIIRILTKRLLHLNTGLFYFFEKVVQLYSFYGTIPMAAVLYSRS